MLTLLILLVIVAAVAFWGVGIYNGLVTARNAFKNAFAQIDVQLQRRFDLIPNLVEVARKYMSHERETLEAVIAARAAAQSGLSAAKASPGDPEAMAQLVAAQGQLNAGLGRLLAVAEADPDLKDGHTTTRARCSRTASSPACSASPPPPCWKSRRSGRPTCAPRRRCSSDGLTRPSRRRRGCGEDAPA